MALSVRYKEMLSRLRELRKHMLPAKFSPTATYTDRQLDHARGYRLLVHAEMESYIEDISRDAVTKAIQSWKSNRKASEIMLSFLAAYHSSWSVNDTVGNEEIIKLAKERVNVKDSINEIIDKAQTQFLRRVKGNNGIKDKNFKELILPVGVDVSELDQTWLTNLDNFGSLRGEIAHKTKGATGVINPKDEYETVKQLVTGLESLDRKILNLCQGL